jgi:hypothetical protein
MRALYNNKVRYYRGVNLVKSRQKKITNYGAHRGNLSGTYLYHTYKNEAKNLSLLIKNNA